jgi:O-antigen ligase
VGLSFYLCATVLPDTEERRRWSVRAICIGAAAALSWATVQGLVAISGREYFPLVLTRIHHLFSVRDPIVGRVGGLAYEPSWLGNQLMVLYIPLLAAATLRRESVFGYRRGWLTVESAMLLWAVAVLALTRSRISQFGFLVLVAMTLIALGWRVLGWVERRLGLPAPGGWNLRRIGLTAFNLLILLAMVAGLVLAAAAAAGQSDPRLWALRSIDDRLEDSRRYYPSEVAFAVGDRLAFAERMVYWTSAFRTFSLYPILGVGPGNAGFLFERTLVDYGLRLTEVQRVVREASYGFPNPKNLWDRLLAETGILGFVLFGWWFISIGVGAFLLWRRGEGFERTLGLAGVFMLVAQIVEGFSLDSYALPQLWLVPGLATSALWASRILADPADEPSPVGATPASPRRGRPAARPLRESES